MHLLKCFELNIATPQETGEGRMNNKKLSWSVEGSIKGWESPLTQKDAGMFERDIEHSDRKFATLSHDDFIARGNKAKLDNETYNIVQVKSTPRWQVLYLEAWTGDINV